MPKKGDAIRFKQGAHQWQTVVWVDEKRKSVHTSLGTTVHWDERGPLWEVRGKPVSPPEPLPKVGCAIRYNHLDCWWQTVASVHTDARLVVTSNGAHIYWDYPKSRDWWILEAQAPPTPATKPKDVRRGDKW